MTVTQRAMVWSLRAVVLWGAAELGLTLYDEGTRELESWMKIQDHGAAMERLRLREREVAGALRPLQARLAQEEQAPARLSLEGFASPENAITAALKQDLAKFGAQGSQASVTISPLGKTLSHAVIDLQWDEPATSAPQVLYALDQKRPYLTVTRIKYGQILGAPMVKGEADVAVNLSIAKAKP
jgi:hypothetical protein